MDRQTVDCHESRRTMTFFAAEEEAVAVGAEHSSTVVDRTDDVQILGQDENLGDLDAAYRRTSVHQTQSLGVTHTGWNH